MRPARMLFLPIVLPAALWACSAEPHGGASVRFEGRGALLAAPRELPPDPELQPCRHGSGSTGDVAGTGRSQASDPLPPKGRA